MSAKASRIPMNKGNEQIKVLPEDVDFYMDQGWKKVEIKNGKVKLIGKAAETVSQKVHQDALDRIAELEAQVETLTEENTALKAG